MGDAPDVYEAAGLLTFPHEAGFALTVLVHAHNRAEVRLHHPVRDHVLVTEDPQTVSFLERMMQTMATAALPAASAPAARP